jgi:chromosomal replication initiation ATPase DnaA
MIKEDRSYKTYTDKKRILKAEIDDVLDFLSSWYETPVEVFMYNGKNRSLLAMRRKAMYLVWLITNAPISMIAQKFNYADHSSFRRNLNIMEAEKRNNPETAKELNLIWDKYVS